MPTHPFLSQADLSIEFTLDARLGQNIGLTETAKVADELHERRGGHGLFCGPYVEQDLLSHLGNGRWYRRQIRTQRGAADGQELTTKCLTGHAELQVHAHPAPLLCTDEPIFSAID